MFATTTAPETRCEPIVLLLGIRRRIEVNTERFDGAVPYREDLGDVALERRSSVRRLQPVVRERARALAVHEQVAHLDAENHPVESAGSFHERVAAGELPRRAREARERRRLREE